MKLLKIEYKGKTFKEDNNTIGLSFTNGFIDFVMGVENNINYILLIAENSYLIIRTKKTMYIPTKGFLKAVRTNEFICNFTLLNNIGYSIN